MPLLLSPVMPSAAYALQGHCPAKPVNPTSTDMHCAFQPCLWQSLTRLSYFSLFRSKASSVRSSDSTVRSSVMMFFVASDTSTMSGLRVVLATCWGSFGALTAASPVQWWEALVLPSVLFLAPKALSWCCTSWVLTSDRWWWHYRCSLRWSWALGHVSISIGLPSELLAAAAQCVLKGSLFWQSRYAGVSAKPQQCRLDGQGRTS